MSSFELQNKQDFGRYFCVTLRIQRAAARHRRHCILYTRGVHGNGEDWDPTGPMGFPWEWE